MLAGMRRAALVLTVAMAMVGAAAGRAAADASTASAAETETAKKVIATWLAAQNQGDWKAYEALYAPEFAGVKRVGKSAKKYDRAKWMKDRKTMFKAPMKVTATAIVVHAAPEKLVVELDQTWEQGTYADTGHKLIELAKGTLLITREELQSSRLILTDAACVKTLFPTAKNDRVGPDPDDAKVLKVEVFAVAGDKFVCRVDHGEGAAADVRQTVDTEIALVGRTSGWTVLGKEQATVTLENPNGDQGESGEVTVEIIPLSPKIDGVSVTVTARTFEPVNADETSTQTLYAVVGNALVEQLALAGKRNSNVEDSSGEWCELVVKDKRHKGLVDLDVKCTVHTEDWHSDDPKKHGAHDEVTTTRYRWDGTSYVAK
jgi:ketosteroid isomerase-like protein